jgi:hypothetical protein
MLSDEYFGWCVRDHQDARREKMRRAVGADQHAVSNTDEQAGGGSQKLPAGRT